jgi:hypothetical protein
MHTPSSLATLLWATASLMASFTASAHAGPVLAAGTTIDARQERQQARIDRGIQQGTLTRREAAHLRGQQRGITRVEGRARADGVLTGQEAHVLDGLQDRASGAIARNTRNGRQAPVRP